MSTIEIAGVAVAAAVYAAPAFACAPIALSLFLIRNLSPSDDVGDVGGTA